MLTMEQQLRHLEVAMLSAEGKTKANRWRRFRSVMVLGPIVELVTDDREMMVSAFLLAMCVSCLVYCRSLLVSCVAVLSCVVCCVSFMAFESPQHD